MGCLFPPASFFRVQQLDKDAGSSHDARKPRHTTHHQQFPERVTITRSHHPFEGQSLEVLRQARMPDGLQFVLILPDGSKSLVPADWTDYPNPASPPPAAQLVGSLDDLLRLRDLIDALLRRSASLPVKSGASQGGPCRNSV